MALAAAFPHFAKSCYIGVVADLNGQAAQFFGQFLTDVDHAPADVDAAVDRVRSGENPELTTREKHTRECFVVAEEGADLAAIEEAIKTMPNYFDEYDTTVTFITEEEMAADHSELPHGGSVLRTGTTGWDNEMNDTLEFTLNLDSNPFFTGSVLTAAARAAYRLNQKGQTGCFTLLDVPPVLLSPVSPEELRAHIM